MSESAHFKSRRLIYPQLQAMPSIIGGILPAVLQAANPATAVANALGASMNKFNQSTAAPGLEGASATPQAATELQQSVLDPAYASAALVKPILDIFYEFLGGEKGEINWDKLSDAPPAETDSATPPKSVNQGVSFLLGNLNGQRSTINVTQSEPSKALGDAIDRTINVSIRCIIRVSKFLTKSEGRYKHQRLPENAKGSQFGEGRHINHCGLENRSQIGKSYNPHALHHGKLDWFYQHPKPICQYKNQCAEDGSICSQVVYSILVNSQLT